MTDAGFAAAAAAGGGADHRSGPGVGVGVQFELVVFDNFVGVADILCCWAFLLHSH